MSDEIKNKVTETSDHKHRHQTTLANLVARDPVYICTECQAKLRPVQAVRVIEKFAFYIMLAGILFSTDLNKPQGAEPVPNATLIWIAKIVASILFYVIVRLILDKFGKVEVISEPVSVKVDLSDEEEAEHEAEQADLERRKEEISAEKQALIELYQQYEASYMKDNPEEAALLKAAEERTEEEAAVPACEHQLKQTWKNYVPGKQTFTCKKCGSKLFLTKKQNNIIQLSAIVAFFALLLRDTLNLTVSNSIYFLKVFLVLVIMGIVQAIFINVFPLRGEKDPE